MKLLPTLVACVFSWLTTAAPAAETAFVIDKLLVGVHQEEDLNSAIVKVLPTGTKLEVIERKGEIAKIQDADGVTGWVDAAYLMKDPPAALQLEQVKQDKQALADRLKAIDAQRGAGDSGTHGQVDALTNENTELKSQLSTQKLRTSELENELAELRKSAGSGPAGGTVAAELKTANSKLEQALDEAQKRISELEAQAGADGALGAVRAAAVTASPVVIAALVLLLLAGFGGGVLLMDFLNRRRHGGFRV